MPMLILSYRGKMYSVFNVKWTHIASVITFIVGSAVCGAAPNMNALIAGRGKRA
jgi:MFS family permease